MSSEQEETIMSLLPLSFNVILKDISFDIMIAYCCMNIKECETRYYIKMSTLCPSAQRKKKS